MKIAIHHRPGSFSDRWIEYCENNSIDFKIVNAFDNDIIQKISECDAFMWHHHHGQFKDALTAKRVLFALEQAGVKVFPDFNTGWHFDDKVAQKYLLEAINAPLVPSYVFYNKKEALSWAKKTTYPKVFKLKGGASAKNVMLVKNYKTAKELISQAFNQGFAQYNKIGNLQESLNKFRHKEASIIDVGKSISKLVITPKFSKESDPERGYIYFQDFIPNNDSDIRVIIIGDRAIAIKRLVRPNDFRASGSGNIIYDKSKIDINIIKTAFLINQKISSQCIAFDFILDSNRTPLVVEISYGFSGTAYDLCPGYWDDELNWYDECINPQEWILKGIIDNT